MRQPLHTPLQLVLLLAAAGATTFLTPADANACACCDVRTTSEILGWDRAGRRVLLRQLTDSCDLTEFLEVYAPTRIGPTTCFDLRGPNPNRAIPCTATPPDSAERDPVDPATLHVTSRFPIQPSQIDPRVIRARLSNGPVDEDTGQPGGTLEVSIRVGNRWRSIARRELILGRPNGSIEDDSELGEQATSTNQPITVRIWPSPSRSNALLEINGDNSSPGMGAYGPFLRWIELPPGLPRVTSASPVFAVPAPDGVFGGLPEAGRAAQALAERYQQRGSLPLAAEFLTTALLTSPTDAALRYALAQTLMAVGQHAGALVLLQDLARGNSAQCVALLQQARGDGAFDPIRAEVPALTPTGTASAGSD